MRTMFCGFLGVGGGLGLGGIVGFIMHGVLRGTGPYPDFAELGVIAEMVIAGTAAGGVVGLIGGLLIGRIWSKCRTCD